MSESLYRKYRPKNFNEVIGQIHIVRTLSNAIRHNRIGHAYLFTGPRGTGKTSLARIFAKTINCEELTRKPENQKTSLIPCEKCSACKTISSARSLDIIEIDAASNTGVDNIRELRETVALPPTSLKYKAYIIDEVHMLSTGAFNALLKTLEEPPLHVIFILATTEIHKVPETILSRVQRFDFSRLPMENIIEKLSIIAKAEKVKIEKEALEMIAISAEGGMRDAESLLGQIISLEDKNITAKEVMDILGTTDKKIVNEVAEMIIKKDSSSAIVAINEILKDGFDLEVFNKSLIGFMRQIMLLKISKKLSDYFSYENTKEQIREMAKLSNEAELAQIVSTINHLLEAQNKISSFALPQLPLEIAIIKSTQKLPVINSEQKIAIKKQETEKRDQKMDTGKQESKNDPGPGSSLLPKKEVAMAATASEKTEKENKATDLDIFIVQSKWNQLLVDIQPYNHSLKALLLNCQATGIEGDTIVVATPYEFYNERLQENGNRLTIEDVFSKILGCKVKMKIVVDKNLVKKNSDHLAEKNDSVQNPLLDSAMEIMGGKIVE